MILSIFIHQSESSVGLRVLAPSNCQYLVVQSELFGTQCFVKLGIVLITIFSHVVTLGLDIYFDFAHADGIK